MTSASFTEYAARNTAPILEVLQREFRDCNRVLEIGSGTGQHAVAFAAAMPHLTWQTSDLDANHASINAWIDKAHLDNIGRPRSLDVRNAVVEPAAFDGVFSANTAHIMGIDAVRNMFALVADTLRVDGIFCLYGPFRMHGAFNTPSNEAFDADLRARDFAMGIRDLEVLEEFGAAGGLYRAGLYAMPANNYLTVWSRRAV